jgi:hypothetical protein
MPGKIAQIPLQRKDIYKEVRAGGAHFVLFVLLCG